MDEGEILDRRLTGQFPEKILDFRIYIISVGHRKGWDFVHLAALLEGRQHHIEVGEEVENRPAAFLLNEYGLV